MSTCRSCGAEILWAVTEAGKKMPVNAERSPSGKIMLHEQPGSDTLAVVLSNADLQALGPERSLYVSHFATCPDAYKHRRRSV